MEVVARMRGLKQLRIVGCTQLTDGALAQLARLPRLTHLDIGCNIHFSDSGIASLAAVASALLPRLVLALSQHIRSGFTCCMYAAKDGLACCMRACPLFGLLCCCRPAACQPDVAGAADERGRPCPGWPAQPGPHHAVPLPPHL